MRFSILSVVAIASSCVAAVGNAVVKNTSTSKIYVWSVGDSIGTKQVVAPGGTFTEALHRAPNAGGIALKITKVDDGLFTSAPTQIFSYSLDGEQVWYDLSTVFGDPFKGQRVTVTSASGQTINWPQGTNPGGSQVKVAKSSDNVVFTVFATA